MVLPVINMTTPPPLIVDKSTSAEKWSNPVHLIKDLDGIVNFWLALYYQPWEYATNGWREVLTLEAEYCPAYEVFGHLTTEDGKVGIAHIQPNGLVRVKCPTTIASKQWIVVTFPAYKVKKL